MAAAACSREEFVRIWHEECQSPVLVARRLGISVTQVHARRQRMAADGMVCETAPERQKARGGFAYLPRKYTSLHDGCAIIWNDAHIWPGMPISRAEAALLSLIPQLRPAILVCNGDVYDGANLSRHDPLGFESKPSAGDELRAVQAHMARIEGVACGAMLFRTVGNHCLRMDRHLSRHAGDFKGIPGFRLSDHLPAWAESWSVHINAGTAGHTVVKHRLGGGADAARTNAVRSGVTIVTGHTHKQNVTPVTDYRGTRWGVQTGMLSDTHQPAHEYAEDHPDPGQPGFAVLTWRGGKLLHPELVRVDDEGVAWFRNQPVSKPRIRVRAELRAA